LRADSNAASCFSIGCVASIGCSIRASKSACRRAARIECQSGTLTRSELDGARSLDELKEAITADGLAQYEKREAELGESVMRQIERQIMLQLIDQRWRDHLTEMAHLREGINLRAMGQRDPLTEWQSEGFDLFSEMIHSLNVDYVRYLMHVEVAQPAETAQNGDQPGDGAPSGDATPAAQKAAPAALTETDVVASKEGEQTDEPAKAAPDKPYVKDEWDKTPRNAPCPCGSGKKFKQCHGASR